MVNVESVVLLNIGEWFLILMNGAVQLVLRGRDEHQILWQDYVFMYIAVVPFFVCVTFSSKFAQLRSANNTPSRCCLQGLDKAVIILRCCYHHFNPNFRCAHQC